MGSCKRIGSRFFNSIDLGRIYNIAKSIANGSSIPATLWQNMHLPIEDLGFRSTGYYSNQIQNENDETYTFKYEK